MRKIDISIIIVNFNTKKLLKNLLISIQNSETGKYQKEIIVIDNASLDGSAVMVKKHFQTVNLIINKINKGYTRANNQGIKKAKGKYLLFLNSDTVLQKNTLLTMIDFLNNSEYKVATCRIELPSGKIDPSCHRGFPTPWAAFSYFIGLEKLFPKIPLFSQYHQLWKDFGKIHQVDVISGAFFLVKKKVIDEVGVFDESFFMYAEDIDLCYRIREKGYKIAFNPNTKIIHYKKSSGRNKKKDKKGVHKYKDIRRKTSEHFFKTMEIFYQKHYSNKYPWIMKKMVLLGIKLVSRLKS